MRTSRRPLIVSTTLTDGLGRLVQLNFGRDKSIWTPEEKGATVAGRSDLKLCSGSFGGFRQMTEWR